MLVLKRLRSLFKSEMLLLRFIRLKRCAAGSKDDVRCDKNLLTRTLTSQSDMSMVDRHDDESTGTFSEKLEMSASTRGLLVLSSRPSSNKVLLVPCVAEDNLLNSENQANSSRSDSNKAAVGSSESTRRSLKDVVTSCEKEWFIDTQTKAKEGDVQMQILLAQMYLRGYGTQQDSQLVSST